MIDYSCLLTERFLQRALDDPAYLTMAASAATTWRARPATATSRSRSTGS